MARESHILIPVFPRQLKTFVAKTEAVAVDPLESITVPSYVTLGVTVPSTVAMALTAPMTVTTGITGPSTVD